MCTQEEPGARKLSALDPNDLSPFDSLDPKVLHIDCFQVGGEHQGRGIGSAMLDRTTEWAAAQGWAELHRSAVDHILPLMAWSGHLSNEALMRRGFAVVDTQEHAGFAEAALHMRRGGHGDEVKDIWARDYSHIPEDQTFCRYAMKKVLCRVEGASHQDMERHPMTWSVPDVGCG